jgi:hypothetical protein
MSRRVFRDEGRAGLARIDSLQDSQFYYSPLSLQRPMTNPASYGHWYIHPYGRNVKLILPNHFYAVSKSCRKGIQEHGYLRDLAEILWHAQPVWHRCRHKGHETTYIGEVVPTNRPYFQIHWTVFPLNLVLLIVNPLQPLNNGEVLFCSIPTDIFL